MDKVITNCFRCGGELRLIRVLRDGRIYCSSNCSILAKSNAVIRRGQKIGDAIAGAIEGKTGRVSFGR